MTCTALLGSPAGPPSLHAQSAVVSVAPDSIVIAPGGEPTVVRVVLRGFDRIARARFTLGRTAVSEVSATWRLLGTRTSRGGTLSSFELRIAAAATAPEGRYAVQLVSPLRAVLSLPLQVHVARPVRTVARTITGPSAPSPAPGASTTGVKMPSRDPVRTTIPRATITLGCRGTAVPLEAGTPVSLGATSVPGPPPYAFSLCANQGFERYEWSVTRIIPAPGAPQISDLRASGEQTSPHAFRVRITRAAPRMLVRVRLRVMTAAGAVLQEGEAEVEVALPDYVPVAAPSVTRYWTMAPRPGGSVQLVNDGIFDPAVTGDPEDGEFWVEGRNLSAPGLRIRIYDGSTSYEATPLSLQNVNGLEIVRARIAAFRPGGMHVGNVHSTIPAGHVPRLGYWAFPTADFSALMGNVSCRLGDPPGRMQVVMPGGERLEGALPPIQGLGFTGQILALTSRSIELRTERGTPGRRVVVVLRMEFETDGPEFGGQFPGPVGVSGDLHAPAAEFRIPLVLSPSTGTLAADSVIATFTASISLRTGIGDIPLGPLEQLILASVNEQLAAVAAEASMGPQVARLVGQQAQTLGGAGRIRYIDRLPDDRLYIEYEK